MPRVAALHVGVSSVSPDPRTGSTLRREGDGVSVRTPALTGDRPPTLTGAHPPTRVTTHRRDLG